MARFTLPRDLYHGKGSLETLKTLSGSRAIVVVGGGSMKKFGFLDRVESYLKEAGFEKKCLPFLRRRTFLLFLFLIIIEPTMSIRRSTSPSCCIFHRVRCSIWKAENTASPR